MEFAKRAWVQIRQQTDGMPKQAWMFLLSMCVILGLVLWLITLYSSSGSRQSITGFIDPDQQTQAMQVLVDQGIDVQTTEGQLTVPRTQHAKARAALASAGLLASDTSQGFKDIADNPWATSEQTQNKLRVALQADLAKTLKLVDGVKSARVFVTGSDNTRFGARNQRPTASVQLYTRGSGNKKKLAVMAAGLVSGAVMGLGAKDVIVNIDGERQRANTEDDFAASTHYEAEQALERKKEEAIYELLRGIEGVAVKVDVLLDHMRREVVTENDYKDGTLISETASSTTSREAAQQSEPGIRANAGANIASATQALTPTLEQTDKETDFSQPLVARTSQQEIGGGKVKQINVSVMVPRSYYVALWKLENPEATEPPVTDDLRALHEAEKAGWMEEAVQQLTLAEIATPEGDKIATGNVSIGMFADLSLEPQAVGMGGFADMVDGPAGTMGLASIFGLGALGILFFMARKATAQQELPSYEELAGVPVSLPTEDDLIGEVEEGEVEMAGVAVDEGSLEAIKMAEQITELITGNPDEASQLLNKWVNDDDF